VTPDRATALLALVEANKALKMARAAFTRMGEPEAAGDIEALAEEINDLAGALCKGAQMSAVAS
jgi:hypothetical protein